MVWTECMHEYQELKRHRFCCQMMRYNIFREKYPVGFAKYLKNHILVWGISTNLSSLFSATRTLQERIPFHENSGLSIDFNHQILLSFLFKFSIASILHLYFFLETYQNRFCILCHLVLCLLQFLAEKQMQYIVTCRVGAIYEYSCLPCFKQSWVKRGIERPNYFIHARTDALCYRNNICQ